MSCPQVQCQLQWQWAAAFRWSTRPPGGGATLEASLRRDVGPSWRRFSDGAARASRRSPKAAHTADDVALRVDTQTSAVKGCSSGLLPRAHCLEPNSTAMSTKPN